MTPTETKENLIQQCQDYIDQRLHRIQNTIQDIQESLTSETKSSAGDKHETGRAMLQLEREKAGKQLAAVQKLQATLDRITANPTTRICLGSLVQTTQANYFVSISAGKLAVNNTTYYAIAINSPIGNLLAGKMTEDTFHFNGSEIRIDTVY